MFAPSELPVTSEIPPSISCVVASNPVITPATEPGLASVSAAPAPASAIVCPLATVPPSDHVAPASTCTRPKLWKLVPNPTIVPDPPAASSSTPVGVATPALSPSTVPAKLAPGYTMIRLPVPCAEVNTANWSPAIRPRLATVTVL